MMKQEAFPHGHSTGQIIHFRDHKAYGTQAIKYAMLVALLQEVQSTQPAQHLELFLVNLLHPYEVP